MSIAITEDHRALAATVADFVARRDTRAGARALLDGADETLPAWWAEAAGLGWLGLHVPEAHGGSGYGLEEVVLVVEELARGIAPGPFVPTVIASAFLATAADADPAVAEILRALATGDGTGAAALGGDVHIDGATVSGDAGVVLGGALAQVLVVAAGDDAAVVRADADGVAVEVPRNLDPTRRSARVTLDAAPAIVFPGGARALTDLARVILAAEAVGLARECTDLAAAYAKERLQFGRVIGTYQAVKHHCANMAVATELATSAVWDAAKAASTGGDQLAFTAAVAGVLAPQAADLCANLSTQVHGGIAITWEHDLHLYLRRATTLLTVFGRSAETDLVQLTRQGVARGSQIELPPEAEQIRTEVRAFATDIKGLPPEEQRTRMIDTGYVMPHWPRPYGREASAVEQLVIEQEFAAAGVKRPSYGITAWNILTLIQYATPDQAARWVRPALDQEVVWCQLFSEPDAGSDAAGITTRATRVDGGWLVNGQKVWTSGAHYAGMGFATVRTNPDVPKHEGITTMVIDMHAPGVEVRPLKMTTGNSEFNEVFFSDVFVPDDDVVGPVDGGWTVARATLGNESVSIGSGDGGMIYPGSMLVAASDTHPDRLHGAEPRLARYLAEQQAMRLLNLRAANRAVAGAGPGPEGAMTKLMMAELGHQAAAILTEVHGPEAAFMEGDTAITNGLVLMHRGMSIAGGTSEIKRNQIGERILGLPRDPLIK